MKASNCRMCLEYTGVQQWRLQSLQSARKALPLVSLHEMQSHSIKFNIQDETRSTLRWLQNPQKISISRCRMRFLLIALSVCRMVV